MSSANAPAFPSFLGIGAAYSGTTWLHENLKRHPQIWLPPIKELHYFDLFRAGASSYFSLPIGTADQVARIFRKRHLFKILGKLLRFGVPFGWTWRYLFGRRDDAWYASLFRKDRFSGEITPTYLNLPKHIVEEVRKLNPDMKIVILLRNPVTRSWSAIKRRKSMFAKQFRGQGRKAAEQHVVQLMQSKAFRDWNDYVTAIKTWRSVFSERQVFIGFHDQLKNDARGLLRSIIDFLGIDPTAMPMTEAVDEVVNSSGKLELPAEYLPQLYAAYLEPLRELEQMLGGPVSRWRATAEEAIAKGSKKTSGKLS